MPAVDTAPIFLAQKNGWFAEEGVEVSIELFTNAQDRQSALQAGTLDAIMTDLVAVAVNTSAGFNLRATTLTDGMFPILVHPESRDKKTVSVGMMEVSVSNFLASQWLKDYEVKKVFINAIPARLEAVASGSIDMGVFPEPVASAGAAKGLEKRIFPPAGGFSPDVMAFTGKALSEKTSSIQAFHRAYNKAVRQIQANPDMARNILVESIPRLNPALKDAMELPEYHLARLPDSTYLKGIIDWTASITGAPLKTSPDKMTDRRFVTE